MHLALPVEHIYMQKMCVQSEIDLKLIDISGFCNTAACHAGDLADNSMLTKSTNCSCIRASIVSNLIRLLSLSLSMPSRVSNDGPLAVQQSKHTVIGVHISIFQRPFGCCSACVSTNKQQKTSRSRCFGRLPPAPALHQTTSRCQLRKLYNL